MKVRGFQVAPAELEGHLLTHHDVADVCVVSIPDDYSGELPLAYIVLSEQASRRVAGNARAALQLKAVLSKVRRILILSFHRSLLRRLIQHVADAKVPYKHLAGGIEFIDTVPKNPSGKMVISCRYLYGYFRSTDNISASTSTEGPGEEVEIC